MDYVRIAMIAGALAAAFGSGFAVDHWRMSSQIDRLKADAATALAKANSDALEKSTALQRQVEHAQQNAQARVDKADAAARSADDVSVRLREQLARNASVSANSLDACRANAERTSVVFQECTDALRALGKDAGRLAADQLTLMEAWPVEKQKGEAAASPR